MGSPKDLVGQRFGCLVVTDFAGYRRRNARIKCRCDCGAEIETFAQPVKRGKTKSCGCSRGIVHGHTKDHATTRTYNSWLGIMGRCENKNRPGFQLYGGRGISVAEWWRDFKLFLADMGECPPGMSIDRWPNNDGNYEPGNCRWATAGEQARNRRSTIIISHDGESMCAKDWAARIGMDYKRFLYLTGRKKISPADIISGGVL